MIELRVRFYLRSLLHLSFECLASFIKARSSILGRRHQEALLEHAFDTISVVLSGHSIVSLLHRLVVKVVELKEIKGGLVSPVYHHSQLGIGELTRKNGLDVGNLYRVVLDMNSSRAIRTQEDPMVDAHMRRVLPSAIEAVLVVFLLEQLGENFLLERR